MASTTPSQSQGSIKLANSICNILSAMGKDADFLYSTVVRCIEDAHKDSRNNLVEICKEIKKGKQKHLTKLRDCLEKEAKEEKLSA
jgi:hypothetical protein